MATGTTKRLTAEILATQSAVRSNWLFQQRRARASATHPVGRVFSFFAELPSRNRVPKMQERNRKLELVGDERDFVAGLP